MGRERKHRDAAGRRRQNPTSREVRPSRGDVRSFARVRSRRSFSRSDRDAETDARESVAPRRKGSIDRFPFR